MIRLIVNADDFGLHPSIDKGILQTHQKGIVTSASVLVTGAHVENAVRLAQAQGLSLGVHLCLTTGLAPASRAATLLKAGRFRRHWTDLASALFRWEILLDAVALEFRAQVQRLWDLGVSPDHLNSHQHIHLMPGIKDIVIRLGHELNLPIRWPFEKPHRGWRTIPGPALKSALLSGLSCGRGRVRCAGAFDAGRLNEARLLRFIDQLRPGNHELSCHPGDYPGVVPEDPTWRYGWTIERDTLCSEWVRERLHQRGVLLCSWGALP